MDLQSFKNIIWQVFNDIEELMEVKNKQYANETNIFKNFEEGSRLLKMTPEKYLWSLRLKHELALLEAIENNNYNVKEVKERIQDCILYCLLLYAMVINKYSDEY